MTELPVNLFADALRHVCDRIIAAEPDLTALDNIVGDGDHGDGMRDGFTALILNKYQAGNSNTLVLLDSTGSLLAERYLGEEVLSVSAAGGFCAVQTPEHLYVYDKSLQLCAVTEASASAICADGSAIVRNGNGVQRRVPE